MSKQPEKIILELDRDSACALLNALAVAEVKPLERTCWEPIRADTYRNLYAALSKSCQFPLQLNSNESARLDLL